MDRWNGLSGELAQVTGQSSPRVSDHGLQQLRLALDEDKGALKQVAHPDAWFARALH